jgi:hypothetical protein
MTITLDLDRDEAVALRDYLKDSALFEPEHAAIVGNAIQDEDERRLDHQQDGEAGGSSAYRQQMWDAGRGHLLL